MRNARTNEVLAIQIGKITTLAGRLDTSDLGRLETDVNELEEAVTALRDQVRHLPKKDV